MIDWSVVRFEYENGSKPREIVKKHPDYDITPKQISNKAFAQGWKNPEEQIKIKAEKLSQNYDKEKARITKKSLKTIEEVLDDEEADIKSKLKAAELGIKISGLDTQKKEILGNIGVEKIFITPEEHKATLEHIKSVINDSN